MNEADHEKLVHAWLSLKVSGHDREKVLGYEGRPQQMFLTFNDRPYLSGIKTMTGYDFISQN